jgi:hypothetical protein
VHLAEQLRIPTADVIVGGARKLNSFGGEK